MKFSIDNKITEKNSLEAIKYLFETENLVHQSIIIYQLNNFIKNKKLEHINSFLYPEVLTFQEVKRWAHSST